MIIASLIFIVLSIILFIRIGNKIDFTDSLILILWVGSSWVAISMDVINTCEEVYIHKIEEWSEHRVIKADSILVTQTKELISFEDSVYDYIVSLNIKHPDIVLKQARIESGNFTSNVFKENNNLFGMKVPYKRANTVIGENRGYAVYNTWKESIIDYALYQTYSGKGLTREEYLSMIGKNYAEDPDYSNKIK